jgi:hypothetical protein
MNSDVPIREIASLREWRDRILFSPQDGRSFDLFRMSMALCGLVYLLASWQNLGDQVADSSFHRVNTDFTFLTPLPGPYLIILGLLLAASLLSLALGFLPRLTAAFAAFCFYYWYGVDPTSGSAHMKLLIFGFLLVAVCPASLRKTLWPLRMVQLTLVSVYFLAGWRKAVFGGWLENPDALRVLLAGPFRTETGAWALSNLPPVVFSAGQYLTLLFELSAPLLFFNHRMRPYGLAGGFFFHLLIALFMQNLIYFSLTVLAFYWGFRERLSSPLPPNSSGQKDKNSAENGTALS